MHTKAQRLFIAAPLNEPVQLGLSSYLKLISETRPIPGRIPPPENWHFTLKFLGQVSEAVFLELLKAMERTEWGHSFRITLNGLGAFPRPSRSSILWMGVEHGKSQLCELAKKVEGITASVGFPRETRPFHPHITLSRIKPPQNLKKLIDQAKPFGMEMQIKEIHIYTSHLSAKGARYEIMRGFPLKT